mmetsp:Transcript_85688/g.220568  ORF Transcript_85688/g.220568 Transcript_85688/m.220568 type:complete len:830 (+) Transcript_85688:3259-5748(+)
MLGFAELLHRVGAHVELLQGLVEEGHDDLDLVIDLPLQGDDQAVGEALELVLDDGLQHDRTDSEAVDLDAVWDLVHLLPLRLQGPEVHVPVLGIRHLVDHLLHALGHQPHHEPRLEGVLHSLDTLEELVRLLEDHSNASLVTVGHGLVDVRRAVEVQRPQRQRDEGLDLLVVLRLQLLQRRLQAQLLLREDEVSLHFRKVFVEALQAEEVLHLHDLEELVVPVPPPGLRVGLLVLDAAADHRGLDGLLDLRHLGLPLVALPEEADVRELHDLVADLHVPVAQPPVDGAQALGAVLHLLRERLQLVELGPLHLLHVAVLVREEPLKGHALLQRHQLLRGQQLSVQVVVEVADLLQLDSEPVELQAVLHRQLDLAGDVAAHLLEEARLLHQLDEALGVGDLQGTLLSRVELHHAAVHLQGDGVIRIGELPLDLLLPLLEGAVALLLQLLAHLLAHGGDLRGRLKVLQEAGQRAGSKIRLAAQVLDPHHLAEVQAKPAACGQIIRVKGLQLMQKALQELAQFCQEALALVRERIADVLALQEVLVTLEHPHRLCRVGRLGDQLGSQALSHLRLDRCHVGLVLTQGVLPERHGVLIVAEDVQLGEGLKAVLHLHDLQLLLRQQLQDLVVLAPQLADVLDALRQVGHVRVLVGLALPLVLRAPPLHAREVQHDLTPLLADLVALTDVLRDLGERRLPHLQPVQLRLDRGSDRGREHLEEVQHAHLGVAGLDIGVPETVQRVGQGLEQLRELRERLAPQILEIRADGAERVGELARPFRLGRVDVRGVLVVLPEAHLVGRREDAREVLLVELLLLLDAAAERGGEPGVELCKAVR